MRKYNANYDPDFLLEEIMEATKRIEDIKKLPEEIRLYSSKIRAIANTLYGQRDFKNYEGNLH